MFSCVWKGEPARPTIPQSASLTAPFTQGSLWADEGIGPYGVRCIIKGEPILYLRFSAGNFYAILVLCLIGCCEVMGMKKQSALVLALCLFALVLAMCLYSAPRLAQEATAYAQAAPVVVIDAGHGGEDGGASSPDGVLESGLNLQFALRMRDLLQFAGVETMMLRETDTALYTDGCSGIAEKKVSDLKNRVLRTNQVPNAVLLSVHQNFFTEAKYRGAQVFYAKTDGSRELAEAMQAALRAGVDPDNHRQAKPSQGVYLMEHVNGTAVLVECGFLSNAAETALLQDEGYQQRLSAAVCGALTEWLEGRGTEDEV